MTTTSTRTNTLEEPDESTRLLPDAEGGCASQGRGQTPLPKTQLGALLAVRIADPIAYTQIFPYINQVLADLHIAAPEQVGFYSGFIDSAYSLAQMVSVYQWGRLSDVVGRRPVVIFGLVGIATSTIAFGLSNSLITLLASRFIGGLVAGNVAVLHSILVEITDESNQNIAVPIYSLGWSTGTIIGSLIGGTFTNGASQYSRYLSWPVFVDHPHLLPCIISAMCALLGVLVGYLFIKETLPSKQIGDHDSSACTLDTEPCSPEAEPPSARSLLAIPAMRAITFSGLALSFLDSAFEVVFTLFCYSPIDAGGLGLQPSMIGNFLAFAGTFAVLLRLVAMPHILSHYDYATTFIACMNLWPAVFASLPLLNMLVASPYFHSGMSPVSVDGFGISFAGTTTEIGIWIGLALVLVLARIASIPSSITMLLIKRHAPVPTTGPITSTTSAPKTSSALGRSNGLVQFAMCVGRTVGPVVVSTLFTALNGSSLAKRWGICWTWSIVMMCFGVLGARMSKSVR